MSEWLDLMLEEIARKQRESREAQEELERRESATKKKPPTPVPAQSK
ncbi:MAG: hypothetical protein OEQ90_05685 [Gammaproteobacteria bacterium]|nr:hypothetical protein [Gammaproteobacteria bacterium]